MNPAHLTRENLSPKQKLALYERLRSIPTPQIKAVKVEENYDYRFEPAKYIHDKLRIKLWRGTAEHPGLVEIVEAYELALRQQHEKRQYDNGERTLSQLRCWQPDTVIQNRIRLAGGHGAGKCVAASEWLTLWTGERKQAFELVGTEFSLPTLKDGQIVQAKAKAEWNALESVYELTTDSGRQVVRNAGHPLWVADGVFEWGKRPKIESGNWREFSKIKEGDLVAVPERLPDIEKPLSLPLQEIKILAYLLGDGCVKFNAVSFSQQDNAQLAEFRSCIESYGCRLVFAGQYDWRVVFNKNGYRKPNPVKQVCERHHIMGKGSRTKTIPLDIFRLSNQHLAIFLSRLYGTDGWASVRPKGRRAGIEIGYCSASLQMVREIQYLLLRFGVHARLFYKAKVNAWSLGISRAQDVILFCEQIGIYGKEQAIQKCLDLARPIFETQAKNYKLRPGRPYWFYKNAPAGCRWEKVESIKQSGTEFTVAIEVPETNTFVTEFYEHNTLTMACLIRHFFDCFLPSVSYVFAPGLEQIKSNIWKEIGKVTLGRGLPGRLLQGMLTDDSRSDHFVKARAVPENTESIQGQHEAYQMIVGDEAEGLADAFWDSLDALTSGGISIILLSANPRTRASRFHRIGADPRVVSFQLNCLYHPNILQNREVVPSASTRNWAEGMLRDHCSIVDAHDEDHNTFEVLWRRGVIYQPDPEFMFRVKGLAPANVSDKNLIPVGRFEAACKRQPKDDRPEFASAGLDVAWFGLDVGTLYCRHNGAVWRAAVLSKQEPSAYYFAVLKLAKELKAKGVRRFHLRVDAGGGFGSGVIEMCKTSHDLKQLFDEVKVYLVHFGATGQAVKDQEHYYDVITELTADFGESLKSLAILNAPPLLEQDLCEREWVPMNVAGKFVKKLEPKKDFRKRVKRSPDDGDGATIAAASEFYFEEKIIGVVRW